ncbi:MAG: hypothetical protein RQ982_04065 [Gammaproteobacteria bacterium]|nr:hypothetical protein [Gammaproteobacteria bacterium]
MIQVVEIIGRSEQGITKPFICRGDDDNTYFVKGTGAGRRSQVCEWIAGNLALELALPIAPFEIVDVPVEIIEGNTLYSELGMGPAFASLKQTIMELNFAAIDMVPDDLQRRVLAFDWWIQNWDRMLSETGGNPNLFWEPEDERLVIIDHNQAFDSEFSLDYFFKYHVFSRNVRSLFEVAFYMDSYAKEFKNALNQWQNICDNIPQEWHYLDVEMSIPANIQLDAIFNILNRCNTNNFWKQS